ncbi:putative BolA-like domain containing protein [Neospora caninum Liverpool]|uniref:BolA-like domain containing protein, putative n=1 Tax=Neospora caninum (strain Liverpool) TaxID=572307 RepID=F0VHS6_NEOCL|nr:putative BolA-like domain containing protein [Neospora caninum Liverpool]CBZ53287.1 putative BolA-like domain containing protein [Neospora caninum Liverpool]CEL67273.1 TPA: BolA-like domain containing protein, putative [Neospora caninum Liverpool]|eukprot:XP_003883319.1 putative BolA-like domain containing protein [Neospora caninum Liverpool]
MASASGVQQAVVEAKLQQALSPALLKLEDKSCGCGAAFDCVIVSEAFDGKKLLQRHRMVNEALKDELPSIHAFSIQCHTPEEWTTKRPQ